MDDSRAQRRRRAGRIVAWTLGGVLVVAIVAVAWIGVRGMLAAQHLRAAQATASSLPTELADPSTASAAIGSVAAETSAARALTSDPVWRLAEGLPWVGPQLHAVSAVAAAADDVAGTALRPLAEAASSFTPDMVRPRNGVIDVAAIAELRTAAQDGAGGVARAAATVDGIDQDRLLPPLRSQVAEVERLLHEVGTGTDALARASALLPAMLGADGPRSYLVVFQNNAEWRSLGGIVGATALLNTDGGRLSLGAQASSGDFPQYKDGVSPMPPELEAIYSTRPARFIQNITQLPEFPVGASLARDMWARKTGTQVDGVVSIDPVALSYLLAATGPVTLPTGDVLTSENAVALLLNEVYLRYPQPKEQDLFFAAAAAKVFEALSKGSVDPVALVSGLSRAADENRLLIWNARPAEQAVLDGTSLQGALPVTDDDRTTFGAYLGDGTGSKMDFYLAAGFGATWCGEGDAALTVTLRNDAPADAATLPDYITGAQSFGVPRGSARSTAWLYLPAGAELESSTADAGSNLTHFGDDQGRRVLTWSVELAPGQQATALVRVRTPHTPAIAVRHTPTVNAMETPEIGADCKFAE